LHRREAVDAPGEGPALNILVTGGAGFIGSHLVDRLLAEGHTVKVIDDCSTGREANVAHLLSHPRFTFLRGTVLNETLVAAAVSDSELVFHLAAAVGVPHVLNDPLWAIVTNTRGTELVLQRAERAGARVLFASTSEIYGLSEDIPFREDGARVLGTTWTHRWCYSTAKALDEHLCFAYADRGLRVSIVRYFNIYGPRMDPAGYGSVIAKFLTQGLAGEPITVFGDGQQSRTFTYVDDAVEATLRAATRDPALGQVFNVGGRTEYTMNALAEIVRGATGERSEITHMAYDAVYGAGFAETRRRVPDIAKAKALLDWEPHVRLADGLQRLIAERQAAA
jgi:UDP-glucose 4-epimerase